MFKILVWVETGKVVRVHAGALQAYVPGTIYSSSSKLLVMPAP